MESQDSLYRQVGQQVRAAREAARVTQDELGRRIRLTRTSITNIENARQSVQLHTLYEIARALELPVTALLPDVEDTLESSVLDQHLESSLSKQNLSAKERRQIRNMLVHGNVAAINEEKEHEK